MGIWIRSQDKKNLLETSNVYHNNYGIIRAIDIKGITMVVRRIRNRRKSIRSNR